MSGADEGCDRLLIDFAFLEADAFVFLLNRRACADLTVALADTHRDMRDLPAPVLARFELAAELLKRFDKEALDVVRLEPLRFGAFHFEPELLHLRFGHRIVR